mgnify:CR=1 FL=1
MIPQRAIDAWREFAPWIENSQIEQDLVISRALIEIYSDPFLKEVFAFRGGTALQKLFFDEPTRYSEDIDLVQTSQAPMGKSIDALRKRLDPWLGEPQRSVKRERTTLSYRFTTEIEPVRAMRLKVEINTSEHFSFAPLQRKKLKCKIFGLADQLMCRRMN